MKRAEFIRSLGLGSSALMAVYCIGTLSSCANEDTPLPVDNGNPNPISNGKVDFTLDLSLAANQALLANGGYIYNGNIIIAKTTSGSFIALSKVCTHQGTTVEYRKDTNDIYCPNHGSRFDITGKVIQSPAPSPLTMYKVEYNAVTAKVRVFEA
ncbi:QcrA and Rieske domain-containing protein [Flectobacillus major]|uniref:QcrA and Rieske domain-containing protein n=1 Tax=Flectobacillus major TaxID=103 RepID=UPI00041BF829|nr:Rieske (2Fe-2S) protein [Flectobacillus major]